MATHVGEHTADESDPSEEKEYAGASSEAKSKELKHGSGNILITR